LFVNFIAKLTDFIGSTPGKGQTVREMNK